MGKLSAVSQMTFRVSCSVPGSVECVQGSGSRVATEATESWRGHKADGGSCLDTAPRGQTTEVGGRFPLPLLIPQPRT